MARPGAHVRAYVAVAASCPRGVGRRRSGMPAEPRAHDLFRRLRARGMACHRGEEVVPVERVEDDDVFAVTVAVEGRRGSRSRRSSCRPTSEITRPSLRTPRRRLPRRCRSGRPRHPRARSPCLARGAAGRGVRPRCSIDAREAGRRSERRRGSELVGLAAARHPRRSADDLEPEEQDEQGKNARHVATMAPSRPSQPTSTGARTAPIPIEAARASGSRRKRGPGRPPGPHVGRA